MDILKTRLEVQQYRKSLQESLLVGLVPTMGALHQGHISLVRAAREQTDVVIASIFVNPNQFNDPEDLKKYPRTIEDDFKMLSESAAVSAVFIPEVEAIYPEPDYRQFDFGDLGNILEGRHRPGHFNGVAQVVSRLFDLIEPHKAFFGQKDFQQLAIVKRMVEMLNYDIQIVACPIIREPDGLAMSSRNRLLSHEERIVAKEISKTLFEALKKQKSTSVPELKKWVIDTLNAFPPFQVEYFDIVYANDFRPVFNWDDEGAKIGCIAIKLGKIRLIDNIFFA